MRVCCAGCGCEPTLFATHWATVLGHWSLSDHRHARCATAPCSRPSRSTPTPPFRSAWSWWSIDPGGRNHGLRRGGAPDAGRAGPRPRRRLLHLLVAQGGAAAASRSTTACSGTPRTTRASRAATTSSTPVPPPTSTSCRWPSTCCATTATSAYCLGSNYIWAWENNKIMREAVLAAGGTVLAERYVPVGETRPRRHRPPDPRLPPELRLQHPDRRLRPTPSSAPSAAPPASAGIDQAARMPVASCSLAEPELVEIGRRGRGRASQLERLLREHRHAGQPRLRRRPTDAASRTPARPRPMPKRPTSPCICWPVRSGARAPPR